MRGVGLLDDFSFLAFVVPAVLALGSSYGFALLLRSRLKMIARPVRLFIAAIAPLAVVFGYFRVWDAIEFARHQAQHPGDGYMGPLAILVYGFPIFVVLAIVSVSLAAYTFSRRV